MSVEHSQGIWRKNREFAGWRFRDPEFAAIGIGVAMALALILAGGGAIPCIRSAGAVLCNDCGWLGIQSVTWESRRAGGKISARRLQSRQMNTRLDSLA